SGMRDARYAATSNGSPMSGRPINWIHHHSGSAAIIAASTARVVSTRRRLRKNQRNGAARRRSVGKLRLAPDVVAIALPPIGPHSPRLRRRPDGPPTVGGGSGPPIGSARRRTARSGICGRGSWSSPSPSLLQGLALLRIAHAVVGEARQIGADE